jgi:hypothetical protein
MRFLWISLLFLLVESGSLLAQRAERFAPFHLPVDHSRGRASAVAQLSEQEQVAVYTAVIAAFSERTRAAKPWLKPRLLSNESGYARHDPMPSPLLRRLLATLVFRGSCPSTERPPCEAAGGVYTVSRIYQIEPGVLRVFVAFVANPERSDSRYTIMSNFAAEEVFRVEQRQKRWVVTQHETVMIT